MLRVLAEYLPKKGANFQADGFKENANWVSDYGSSLLPRMNSLFLRIEFPVSCRTGNRRQHNGIAAQKGRQNTVIFPV
jgi:hypothetical protein